MEDRSSGCSSEGIAGKTLVVVTVAILLFMILVFCLFVFPRLAEKNSEIEIVYAGQPRLGSINAPVKIMEFADFKCPSCKVFHDEILPKLKKEFIDTGKVQMYFTNFQWIGEDSVTAGMMGEAIFHQDNASFWKYYDAIYSNQQDEHKVWATLDFLLALIDKYVPDIDRNKVIYDMNNHTYEKLVSYEFELARKMKLDEVPTFYVNGKKIKDPLNYNEFKKAINGGFDR